MEEPSPLDGSSTSSGNCLSNKQKYDSVAGRSLCKRILEKYLPYEPHDYVLDGICPVMDGYDLLATTPTGSGKSGYYILLMLVVREIAADESLMIGEKRFPKDPVMILVLPTKALEDDMVHFDWPLMRAARDRGTDRQLHSTRLEEYGQQSFPEVFGVDTAGTLAENEPSVGGRMSSGA